MFGAAGQHHLERGLARVVPGGQGLGDERLPGPWVRLGEVDDAGRPRESREMKVDMLGRRVTLVVGHDSGGVEDTIAPGQTEIVGRQNRGSGGYDSLPEDCDELCRTRHNAATAAS